MLIVLLAFCVLQRLESTDFDEKKEINKRKQLILEGKASPVFFLFYFLMYLFSLLRTKFV